MNQARGQFLVIRIDGSEEVHNRRPTIRSVEHALGADILDTVILDRDNQVVMLVDDTGLIDRLPVNERATALVREVFGPRYPNKIHGDVAICNDEDFA